MTITWKTGLLALLLLTAPLGAALAQGAPPVGGPEPDPTPNPTAVPLDGGASLLLAAGVGLGIRRLRARRRA